MSELWSLLDEVTDEAIRGLFLDFGATVDGGGCVDESVFTAHEKVAIIGFGEEGLRGSLVLAMPDELLEQSCPIAPPFSAADLADWAGELANQLLGRIKRRLLRTGLKLRVGAPTVMAGTDMRVMPRRHEESRTRRFESGGRNFRIRFEVDTDPGFALKPPATEPADSSAKEGDLLLF